MTGQENKGESSQPSYEWHSLFFTLFTIILAVSLIYVFYRTPLRTRLENELFDLRTRMKPPLEDTSRVALVTFNSADIVKIDGPLAKRPTIHTLLKVLGTINDSGAEAIVLILPHQDFDYDDDDTQPLVQWVRSHSHSYIGTFDYNSVEPGEIEYPAHLASLGKKALGAGTLLSGEGYVIRKAPIQSYVGANLRPNLMYQVAIDFSDSKNISLIKEHSNRQLIRHRQIEDKHPYVQDYLKIPHILINYQRPHQFLTVSASHLIQKKKLPYLQGRIILIGYTAYRSSSATHTDSTYFNSPWEGELNHEGGGIPLLFLKANVLLNLINGTWLTELDNIYIQPVLITLMCFVSWFVSPAFSVILFVLVFFGLLTLHGYLMTFQHIFIPLSDTVLFASLATIGGALLRAQREGKLIIIKRQKAKSQKVLAILQGRFMNRFCQELDAVNAEILETLNKHTVAFASDSTIDKTYHKTITSSIELKEYLAGIKQFTAISENINYQVKKDFVVIHPVINKIINQFENIIDEKQIRINILIPPQAVIYTDIILLEPILFNFISNAVKYSPPQTQITIGLRGSTHLYVKDEGMGIPAEFHEKIFEKFYRIKNDSVYKIKGNGLGLFLCRYFAEKLSSEISLKSQQGKGACFFIKIPIKYHK